MYDGGQGGEEGEGEGKKRKYRESDNEVEVVETSGMYDSRHSREEGEEEEVQGG